MPGFKFPHVHTHLVILLDMYIVVFRLLVYTYVFQTTRVHYLPSGQISCRFRSMWAGTHTEHIKEYTIFDRLVAESLGQCPTSCPRAQRQWITRWPEECPGRGAANPRNSRPPRAAQPIVCIRVSIKFNASPYSMGAIFEIIALTSSQHSVLVLITCSGPKV